MTRHAGQYTIGEAWTLCDRRTRQDIGTRAYPTLQTAISKRAHLVAEAQRVSRECAEEVQQRCDIRKL